MVAEFRLVCRRPYTMHRASFALAVAFAAVFLPTDVVGECEYCLSVDVVIFDVHVRTKSNTVDYHYME